MSRPELTEVLAGVNRLRAERGLEPLTEMPKGTRLAPWSCPIACALRNGKRVRVHPSGSLGGTWKAEGDLTQPLPDVLNRFAVAFDKGAYPDLVA